MVFARLAFYNVKYKYKNLKQLLHYSNNNDHNVFLCIVIEQWKREYNMAVIPNDEAKTRLQNAIEEYIRNHDRTKEEEKIKAKVG